MPLVRSALIATAACLIGAAAYAQPAGGAATGDSSMQQAPAQTPQAGNPPGPSGSSDMNPGASTSAPAGSTDTTGPAGVSGSTDMSAQPNASGAAANTSANVTTDANGTQVIASQPVPDTPANRKAYGKPLSMTGKRTPPAGN
jgi:hypothetical protein